MPPDAVPPDSLSFDYAAHLRRESARFHDCLAAADPAAGVPSCPDWTAADLLWHLTEVQLFWGMIVRDRLQDPGPAQPIKPDVDYQGLLDGFLAAADALQDALAATADDTPVWTWADEQTVGFVRRRQAHEALIHRLDAELTTGAVTPVDPALATDGVDEALVVMYGGYPSWATFAPPTRAGRVLTTDTGASWVIGVGRFSGTSPNSGKTYDDPTIDVITHPMAEEPAFTISGSAGDLDAWLWKRAAFPEPAISGDPAAIAEFLSVIAAGIQ